MISYILWSEYESFVKPYVVPYESSEMASLKTLYEEAVVNATPVADVATPAVRTAVTDVAVIAPILLSLLFDVLIFFEFELRVFKVTGKSFFFMKR